jgi:hypothetical protein
MRTSRRTETDVARIRRQLEWLGHGRLTVDLSPDQQARYEALCREEEILLAS